MRAFHLQTNIKVSLSSPARRFVISKCLSNQIRNFVSFVLIWFVWVCTDYNMFSNIAQNHLLQINKYYSLSHTRCFDNIIIYHCHFLVLIFHMALSYAYSLLIDCVRVFSILFFTVGVRNYLDLLLQAFGGQQPMYGHVLKPSDCVCICICDDMPFVNHVFNENRLCN